MATGGSLPSEPACPKGTVAEMSKPKVPCSRRAPRLNMTGK